MCVCVFARARTHEHVKPPPDRGMGASVPPWQGPDVWVRRDGRGGRRAPEGEGQAATCAGPAVCPGPTRAGSAAGDGGNTLPCGGAEGADAHPLARSVAASVPPATAVVLRGASALGGQPAPAAADMQLAGVMRPQQGEGLTGGGGEGGEAAGKGGGHEQWGSEAETEGLASVAVAASAGALQPQHQHQQQALGLRGDGVAAATDEELQAAEEGQRLLAPEREGRSDGEGAYRVAGGAGAMSEEEEEEEEEEADGGQEEQGGLDDLDGECAPAQTGALLGAGACATHALPGCKALTALLMAYVWLLEGGAGSGVGVACRCAHACVRAYVRALRHRRVQAQAHAHAQQAPQALGALGAVC